MVGRLVEQEHIGRADEKFREGQARALAAGEGLDVLLPRFAAEADPEERRFELVLPGIATGEIEFVLDVLVFLEDFFQSIAGGIGHGVLDVAHLMGEAVELGECQLGFIDDSVGGIEDGILGKDAELDGAGDGNVATVSGELAGKELEKAGLAGAVGADEADALPKVFSIFAREITGMDYRGDLYTILKRG